MRNKYLLSFVLLLCMQFCLAQSGDLQVMGTTPHLYLIHSVQPKETWYGIGRSYNIAPKEIATFNATTIDKPLAIGQQVKVPLTVSNFSQDGKKQADEVFINVYHTIQEKEWMYRVSVNYNKVPIESLEKWNGINRDQAKAGLKIVVGYLKVKSAQSALASRGSNKIMVTDPITVTNTAKADEKKAEIKEEKKIEPVAERQQPITTKAEQPTQEPKPAEVNHSVALNNKGGYFKIQYEENGKSVSGPAGIFKSTSGWNDGKYYALVNNVAVGTIVKVNNPLNGKTIYAKVLGNLPDMKESAGLTARISDAGATELEANGTRFNVEVKF